jgi:hypothetical protein
VIRLWIFAYDPEKKIINALEVTKLSKSKKVCESRSKFEEMLIVFFYIQGGVMAEWDPRGQTVNQHYRTEIVTKLREQVRRKQPGLWRKWWILHQDNTPSHNALSVKQFLSS